MKCYINAIGTTNYSHVNCRAEPNLNSRIEFYLTTIGTIVEFIKEENDWRNYKHGGKEFWVRNDVHDWAELKEHVITLEYISQNDADSNRHPNDCGIASIAILMEYMDHHFDRTVNQLAIEMGLVGSNFTNFGQLINISRKYKFDPEYIRPLQMTKLLKLIYDNTPVLTLVNYDKLIRGKFYGHFLVSIGFDGENIITHDPNTKAYMKYPIFNFAEALAQIGTDGNMPFQGMILKGKKK